jgi:hypothetical protein
MGHTPEDLTVQHQYCENLKCCMILSVPSHQLSNNEIMPKVPTSEDMCSTEWMGDLRCPSKRRTKLKTNHQQSEILGEKKNPHCISIARLIAVQCLLSLNIFAVTLKYVAIVKNPEHAFLRKGSKAVGPVS